MAFSPSVSLNEAAARVLERRPPRRRNVISRKPGRSMNPLACRKSFMFRTLLQMPLEWPPVHSIWSLRMRFGTPLSPNAVKVMLLGAGELGKEVIIELQRLGVETVAVDRYVNAPGQQAAHPARP